ncbi:MAG TPA: peptide-methionine (S)-S-oxide reductase MsrA [Gemmatimonadaceae bacterium]|nr:peptide-methionine (S)-S-oxide reductase MsrA [Gemmatimonadaceae bacterium]
MSRTLIRGSAALGAAAIAVFLLASRSTGAALTAAAPSAALDTSLAAASGRQIAVLSGGCFWGMQLVFEHVKGVTDVEAGYAGGAANTATYEQVSTGTTGHAESVRITYDPSQVTYGQLLRVFFGVAHDPTELNRQGPDVGTQYRSMISYATPEQERIAKAYIAQMTQAKTFPRPIVTQVVPLKGFYPAEAYHQDYAVQHPTQLYIAINDLPKVKRFQHALPSLYREQRVAYAAVSTAAR